MTSTTSPAATTYRANGTPVFAHLLCQHENQSGVNNTHWECDDCGLLTAKTPAQIAFCAASQR